MKRKILILGVNGGIGKYLVDYFICNSTQNIELIGVGRSEIAENKAQIEYIRMDISNKDEFKKLPEDVYAVIHLAGAMPSRMEGYNPEAYIQTNIVGTFNVLQYCIERRIDRILYSQSFGDIKDRAEDTLVLNPFMEPRFKYNTDHSLYIISKNTAVELIKQYHEMYDLKAFIFRLPTIYSWSKNDSYYVDGKERKRAWRYLIDQAEKGNPIEVWGDPNRKKDMVYVKDFCQMLYKACFVNIPYGYYNVGTGIGTTLLDQIKGMVDVFGEEKKSELIMRPEMQNAPQYIMDITNAINDLGYEPAYSYIDMLKDMKIERELGRY